MIERSAASNGSKLDATLRARLNALDEEGQQIWQRFDIEVRQREWHPFVAADLSSVLQVLQPLQEPGLRFLEWGSGAGVITIMADLLGFEAYGIEIDPELVAVARDLAQRSGSGARFAEGSFLPAGYEYRSPTGDPRLGTIGRGSCAYPMLQHALADFDLVYGYPWSGEEGIMHDVMHRYGGPGARLLLHGGSKGVQIFRNGRR